MNLRHSLQLACVRLGLPEASSSPPPISRSVGTRLSSLAREQTFARPDGMRFLGHVDGHPAIIDPATAIPTIIFPRTKKHWAFCISLASELKLAAETGDAP